jgi:hypothetical protein
LAIRAGAGVASARKQAGALVLTATGARLARWSGRTGGFAAESAIPAWIESPRAVG